MQYLMQPPMECRVIISTGLCLGPLLNRDSVQRPRQSAYCMEDPTPVRQKRLWAAIAIAWAAATAVIATGDVNYSELVHSETQFGDGPVCQDRVDRCKAV